MALRIVDVEVAWVTLPLSVARGLSGGPISQSTDMVVRITTDDGLRGIGFDAIKNGGVTEFLKVAALCEAMDADASRTGGLGSAQAEGPAGCLGLDGRPHAVLLAPHHVPHFHVQLAAAQPHAFMVEYFHPEKQHPAWLHLFDGYPAVRDGHMECPNTPGWGMTINDGFLREHGTLLHWRD